MPRPNRPRAVFAEEHLARRIAQEREHRGWTTEGLAKRMSDAGCAMTGSAVYKIEKGEPRRRIVVDELVAFARVFNVPVSELLLPPEVAADRDLAKLVQAWGEASDDASDANATMIQRTTDLRAYVETHPDLPDLTTALVAAWTSPSMPEETFDGFDQILTDRLKDLNADWSQASRLIHLMYAKSVVSAKQSGGFSSGEHTATR